MAKKYLAWMYFKHFVIILSVLELFFLLIDFLQNQKDLPDSANLITLYLYFEAVSALKITLVLSLIFGALSMIVSMIRTNEIVALLSLGYSKQQIIKPVFVIATIISLCFITINATSIGYFYENGQALLKNKSDSAITENLFFKFDDNYIYMQKLNPLTQQATGVKLFTIKNGIVTSIIDSKNGQYKDNNWVLSNTKIINIPAGMQINKDPLTISTQKTFVTLNNFKPKVIDSVSNLNTSLTIVDMAEALFVLKDQSIDTERIRQMLFSSIVLPLLAPVGIVIIFAFTPISSRFFDVTTFASSTIFVVLASFGIISALGKAKVENIQLSFVILLLAVVLSSYAFRLYKRELA